MRKSRIKSIFFAVLHNLLSLKMCEVQLLEFIRQLTHLQTAKVEKLIYCMIPIHPDYTDD